MNNSLPEEISSNLKEIYYRTLITAKLIGRLLLRSGQRTSSVSFNEYDPFWRNFWESGEYFRTDLKFVYNDKTVDGPFSPFEFKEQGVVRLLEEKISQHNIKTVLEIGSGAGLNLLFLAPRFPDVEFVGLEPTGGGVTCSREFLNCPPPQFEEAHRLGRLDNVRIVKGSIIDDQTGAFGEQRFDLVYSTAVLEQLNNFADVVFENIFNLTKGYFFFYEEWLEANYLISNYKTLVDNDYFRISWNYLNRFDKVEIIERSIPALQPSWLKYGAVFGRKLDTVP